MPVRALALPFEQVLIGQHFQRLGAFARFAPEVSCAGRRQDGGGLVHAVDSSFWPDRIRGRRDSASSKSTKAECTMPLARQ